MSRAKTKDTSEAKSKFYAVRKGHKPGIYTSWRDCNHQVHGYRGHQFKGFESRREAEQYLSNSSSAIPSGSTVLLIPKTFQKRAKSPTLVKVKRSRSASLGSAGRPSTTAAQAFDTTGDSQDHAARKSANTGEADERREDDMNSPPVSSNGQLDAQIAQLMQRKPLPEHEDDVYQVEYDGASKNNPGPAGAGALVRCPDGSVVCELREGIGSATNNVAEYRAFILGLKGALDRGIYRVRVQGDSKLVCEQVLGRWKVNQPTLAILCKEAQRLIENFSEFSVQHVDRELNSAADQLANEAVSLPETKFVSSFDEAGASLRLWKAESAPMLGDPNWRQSSSSSRYSSNNNKTYGAFDFAQSAQLRRACTSYYLGYHRHPAGPSASLVVGAQWLRNIFSPHKAKRALAFVARPRVSNSSWILTRRCFTNMAVRLLL